MSYNYHKKQIILEIIVVGIAVEIKKKYIKNNIHKTWIHRGCQSVSLPNLERHARDLAVIPKQMNFKDPEYEKH